MAEIRTKTPIKTPFKMLFKITQEGSDFLTDILSPRRCPVYGDIVSLKGNPMCSGYMVKLSWVRRPACRKRGREVLDETIEYCRDCTRHKYNFNCGLSLINYDDTASRSMARIKYNDRREYLDFYSEAMVRKMGKCIRSMGGDALIPVPIHLSRLRERGLNQAEELVRRPSGPLGVPVNASVPKRERKTAPQKNLDSSGRLENPEQTFTTAALPSAMQKVILVNDIYTTGSTIEAYARALRRAGAGHAYFAIISVSHGQWCHLINPQKSLNIWVLL